MEIILYQPEIPQNTGNIVRTCSATNSSLTLVRPLGFQVTNRWLKRAGLDYWEGVSVSFLDNLEEALENSPHPFYFFSSKAKKCYTSIDYSPTDRLIFGSETRGLPQAFHDRWGERFYTLPMRTEMRCLNLANTVAIVVYEAHRQQGFKFL